MPLQTPSDYAHGFPKDASTHFTAHCKALADFLTTTHSADRDTSLSPYPLYVPPARIAEVYALFAALHPALTAIVRSWWARPDWHSSIPMSPKITRVLRSIAVTRPYDSIGSIRPDYLIPENPGESLRICEINARFIFNGFYHAVKHDSSVQALGFYGHWKPASLIGKDVENAFAALADPTQPTALVTGKEAEDVKHHNIGLGPYHAAHPSSRIVHPASLRLTEDGVLTDGNSTFNQALLQLHQYEIEDMDEEVLLALARICHNDLRTIYIVHDKRILGLIRRELPWLMAKGFITQHQASCLANGIAETHLPGDSMFHELAMVPGLGPEEKDKWTLKICTSGKGDGMVLGKDVDRDSWNKLLLAQSDTTPCSSASRDQPYLLQRYYPSKTVNLLVDGDDGSPQHVSWNIVGTILIINRTLIGNTGFRTSISDIISLSSNIKGKCMVGATTPGIPPTLTLPAKAPRYLVPPKTAIIAAPPHSPSAEHAAAVQASLTNHGLAIIILPDADPRSDYLVSITQLLGCPLAHSAQHGILWDVAPSPTLSSGARSHTSATFPWHTDCSFERSPPRFFGLHIVRHDRFGGGTLRLLPTDDILAALPPAVLDTLRAPVFRFDVPREFDKGESSTTGAVLSGPKIRWRREIMHGVTAEAQTALDAVEKALDEIDDNAYVLGPDLMRPGVVVCIDNGRFLHARSQVKDPERLLRRVRWGAEEF